MSISILPLELLEIEIFHKLPIEGLVRAYQVCRTWRTLAKKHPILSNIHDQHYHDNVISWLIKPTFTSQDLDVLISLLLDADKHDRTSICFPRNLFRIGSCLSQLEANSAKPSPRMVCYLILRLLNMYSSNLFSSSTPENSNNNSINNNNTTQFNASYFASDCRTTRHLIETTIVNLRNQAHWLQQISSIMEMVLSPSKSGIFDDSNVKNPAKFQLWRRNLRIAVSALINEYGWPVYQQQASSSQDNTALDIADDLMLLQRQYEYDSPAFGYPVTSALQSRKLMLHHQFKNKSKIVHIPNKIKEYFDQHDSHWSGLISMILVDNAVLRLMMVLYGVPSNFKSEHIQREYTNYASYLCLDDYDRNPYFSLLTARWGETDTVYNIAVHMDTAPKWKLLSIYPSYSHNSITRDSPLSESYIIPFLKSNSNVGPLIVQLKTLLSDIFNKYNPSQKSTVDVISVQLDKLNTLSLTALCSQLHQNRDTVIDALMCLLSQGEHNYVNMYTAKLRELSKMDDSIHLIIHDLVNTIVMIKYSLRDSIARLTSSLSALFDELKRYNRSNVHLFVTFLKQVIRATVDTNTKPLDIHKLVDKVKEAATKGIEEEAARRDDRFTLACVIAEYWNPHLRTVVLSENHSVSEHKLSLSVVVDSISLIPASLHARFPWDLYFFSWSPPAFPPFYNDVFGLAEDPDSFVPIPMDIFNSVESINRPFTDSTLLIEFFIPVATVFNVIIPELLIAAYKVSSDSHDVFKKCCRAVDKEYMLGVGLGVPVAVPGKEPAPHNDTVELLLDLTQELTQPYYKCRALLRILNLVSERMQTKLMGQVLSTLPHLTNPVELLEILEHSLLFVTKITSLTDKDPSYDINDKVYTSLETEKYLVAYSMEVLQQLDKEDKHHTKLRLWSAYLRLAMVASPVISRKERRGLLLSALRSAMQIPYVEYPQNLKRKQPGKEPDESANLVFNFAVECLHDYIVTFDKDMEALFHEECSRFIQPNSSTFAVYLDEIKELNKLNKRKGGEPHYWATVTLVRNLSHFMDTHTNLLHEYHFKHANPSMHTFQASDPQTHINNLWHQIRDPTLRKNFFDSNFRVYFAKKRDFFVLTILAAHGIDELIEQVEQDNSMDMLELLAWILEMSHSLQPNAVPLCRRWLRMLKSMLVSAKPASQAWKLLTKAANYCSLMLAEVEGLTLINCMGVVNLASSFEDCGRYRASRILAGKEDACMSLTITNMRQSTVELTARGLYEKFGVNISVKFLRRILFNDPEAFRSWMAKVLDKSMEPSEYVSDSELCKLLLCACERIVPSTWETFISLLSQPFPESDDNKEKDPHNTAQLTSLWFLVCRCQQTWVVEAKYRDKVWKDVEKILQSFDIIYPQKRLLSQVSVFCGSALDSFRIVQYAISKTENLSSVTLHINDYITKNFMVPLSEIVSYQTPKQKLLDLAQLSFVQFQDCKNVVEQIMKASETVTHAFLLWLIDLLSTKEAARGEKEIFASFYWKTRHLLIILGQCCVAFVENISKSNNPEKIIKPNPKVLQVIQSYGAVLSPLLIQVLKDGSFSPSSHEAAFCILCSFHWLPSLSEAIVAGALHELYLSLDKQIATLTKLKPHTFDHVSPQLIGLLITQLTHESTVVCASSATALRVIASLPDTPSKVRAEITEALIEAASNVLSQREIIPWHIINPMRYTCDVNNNMLATAYMDIVAKLSNLSPDLSSVDQKYS